MNHEQDNSGGFTPANWLAIIGLVVAGMVGYSALAADNSSNKTKLDQHADQIKALTSDNKRILDLLTELRVDVRYLRQAADKPQ